MRKAPNYWTKERCKEISLTCDTRMEFLKKCVSAYNNSREFGWLDELCSHMKANGNLRKRLVYVYEFPDNHAYVGITCNEKRRERQHMEMGGSVYDHITVTNLHPIKKIISNGYVDVNEAQKLEGETVDKYRLNNWNILNKKETGGLGGSIIFWNKENCHEKAMLCKSRKELSILYSSAYISARKNGWIDEICSHMDRQRKPLNFWNYETCKKAASEFKSRFDFSHKRSGAYFVSSNNNWLDEFYPKKNLITI